MSPNSARFVTRTAQTICAELHLRDGLLAGDQQRATVLRHLGKGRQQQRRLTDAGLAADEHERGRHEPATKDTVELGNPGGDPRCLVDLDVDEAQKRPRRSFGRCAADDLLDERSEGVAPGALSEPPPGGVAAVGARVVDGRFGHPASLGVGPDGNRADCVTTYAATDRSTAPAAISPRNTTSTEFPSGSWIRAA